MSLNNLKKMIIFSSPRNRKIIEKFIEDVAETERRSASAIIENTLLNTIYCEHSEVNFWISYLYYNECSIENLVQIIFEWVESGTENSPKYENLLPILEFSIRKNSFNNPSINGSEIILPHLYSQFESLCNKIEYEAEKEKDLLKKNTLVSEVNWLKNILDDLIKNPSVTKVSTLLYAIKRNWTILKGYNITYRALSDLISLCSNWENNSESRLELINILKDISKEWKDE